MSSYIPSEDEKEKFMARAIELSEEGAAKGCGGPFGSVVVKEGKIVAEGYNRKFEDFDPSAHAEVVAIRNAGKALRTPELQGCILFTSCEPCPMCAATIWWSRLDRVYYAHSVDEDNDPLLGSYQSTILEFVNTPIDNRSIPGEQVKSKAEEAFNVIKKYF